MKKPFSSMYRRYLKKGMEGAGLCESIVELSKINQKEEKIFELFQPTIEDKDRLFAEGKDSIFWGSGYENPRYRQFTTLRQTIVLFCAAINKEL